MVEVPNFTPGNGARLVTDRYDFQDHVTGANFRHNADIIVLSPAISVNGGPASSDLQEVITQINALVPQVVPDATTSTKGLIQLAGDLAVGTATSPVVTGIRGFPIQNATPNSGDVLTWTGSFWTPQALTSSFSTITVSGASNLNGTVNAAALLNVTGQLAVSTPNHVTIAATGTNHDVSLTSGRDIDLTAFDDIHLTTSGGSNADIIVIASRNATFRSNSGTTTVTSISGTTEITSSGGGVNITAPTSNISISAPGSGIISIGAGYAISVDSGSGGFAINSGDLTVNQTANINGNLIVFSAATLNDNVFLGANSSNLVTVRSTMKFNTTGRIQWQAIVLNNANQTVDIRQYKYLVIPSGIVSVHTYTLSDASTTDGDWFQIYNASSVVHNLAGAIGGTIGIGNQTFRVKIGGSWIQAGKP